MTSADAEPSVAQLREQHAREIAEAREEARVATEALAEAKVKHEALAKTLRQLQFEHRRLADDHERLSLVIDAQARASAEAEFREQEDARAQLERVGRSPATTPRGDADGALPLSDLRRQLEATARQVQQGQSRARPHGAERSETPRGAPSVGMDGAERRRNSRTGAAGPGARATTPSHAPPSAPPRAHAGLPAGLGVDDLAGRLRELESVASSGEVRALREENAALRAQLEQLETTAATTDAANAKLVTELSSQLRSTEARAKGVETQLQHELTVLRGQAASLRKQVHTERVEARSHPHAHAAAAAAAAAGVHAGDLLISPRTPRAASARRAAAPSASRKAQPLASRGYPSAYAAGRSDEVATLVSAVLAQRGVHSGGVDGAMDDDSDSQDSADARQARMDALHAEAAIRAARRDAGRAGTFARAKTHAHLGQHASAASAAAAAPSGASGGVMNLRHSCARRASVGAPTGRARPANDAEAASAGSHRKEILSLRARLQEVKAADGLAAA